MTVLDDIEKALYLPSLCNLSNNTQLPEPDFLEVGDVTRTCKLLAWTPALQFESQEPHKSQSVRITSSLTRQFSFTFFLK